MATDIEQLQGMNTAARPRRGAGSAKTVLAISALSVATVVFWSAAGALWLWSAQEATAARGDGAVRLARASLRGVDGEVIEPAAAAPQTPGADVTTTQIGDAVSIRVASAHEAPVAHVGVELEPEWRGARDEGAPMAQVVAISPQSSLAGVLCVGDAIVEVSGSPLTGLTGTQLAQSFETVAEGARNLEFAILTGPMDDGQRRSLRVIWGDRADEGLESRSLTVDRRECAS